MKGKLIVVEGACDGIGKTTQYNLLKENLGNEQEVVTHHFPSYNTDQGKLVENYLKGNYGETKDMSLYFIHSLYAIDRAVTWHSELEKEYNNGKIILLDRYTPSSLIYQPCLIDNLEERKKAIRYMEDYEYNKLRIPKPDCLLFLTAPFDLVMELKNNRLENEGIKQDIHEKNIAFMKKVYLNAIFVSQYLNWDKVECSKNHKMRPIEDIQEELLQKIKIKR